MEEMRWEGEMKQSGVEGGYCLRIPFTHGLAEEDNGKIYVMPREI